MGGQSVGNRTIHLRFAGALGACAVIVGAFGAHALDSLIPEEMLTVYETGVRYHFYHAIAMLAVAAGTADLWASRWASRACAAWGLGIVVFSGSLYLLAITEIRWLGAITPIGGAAMILGWVFAALAASALKRDSA